MVKLRTKFSALSMAEVLVVLAIAAVTLVAAGRITVNMFVTVRDDEIRDYTTGISLQALEIAKSPDDVRVSAPIQLSNFEGAYQVNMQEEPAVLALQPQDINNRISRCPQDSIYRVDYTYTGPSAGTFTQPNVCLQIFVNQSVGELGQPYFELEAITVTELGSGTEVRTIKGYRRGEFIQNE